MLICEDDLVEIRRDLDFLVGEIVQPGALTADSIGQKRKDVAGRDGDHSRLGLMFERRVGEVATSSIRTVIDSQVSTCHG